MLRKLSFVIIGLCLCLGAGCVTNPITGEQQFMLISADEDVEIGRSYAPEIEKQFGGRIPNPALQSYVDSVGQKVARVSHRPDFQYQFVAVNDDSLNAVALPGGYIFITKAMLENMQTEAQLAAILAHETTHVVARHSSEAMSRQIGIDMLLSAVVSEQTPQALSTVAGLSRQIIELGYSRDQEKEADLAGMDYMVRAGYGPHGMVETMQMLQDQHSARPITFLSTHPAPENRVAYLKQRIATSYASLTGLRVGREDYQRSVLSQLRP